MTGHKHKHSLSTLVSAQPQMSNGELGGEVLDWMDDLEISEPRLRILAERLVHGPAPGAGDCEDVPFPSVGTGRASRFSASALEKRKDDLSDPALGKEIKDWLLDMGIGRDDAIFGRMHLLAERLVEQPLPTHTRGLG